MSEPATPDLKPNPVPVPASCCDTVRDLVVRGVRVGEIHRDSAVPILATLGFEPVDVEELVHAAEEAGQ
jgi:hypothetical protein